ncbi:hypothetical protein [Nitrosovibrio sp. Nv17]|uniref:hypothetical protein n=1 Tax=Nitrosovibrio sp. Nv17 TaxID=1855339 RepID=UPI0009087A5C|nr:hypothetical protein [Nitrosovibrio sp. Nv17]SFW14245.1 hypothetical protein SAMN05216414_102136 [Nitrosovibrio sp. Nv17]
MKTMFEMLMTAPPEHVTRCRIALIEIAHGRWDAAAASMQDAIDETESEAWASDCADMRNFCRIMDNVKRHGLAGTGVESHRIHRAV